MRRDEDRVAELRLATDATLARTIRAFERARARALSRGDVPLAAALEERIVLLDDRRWHLARQTRDAGRRP